MTTINNFIFRGNQRRRLTRETMKLRSLNQSRLSMVAVVATSPVERRLQKKWKRRWAAEAGGAALGSFPAVFCPINVLVLLPPSPHEASRMRWGTFPVVPRCLTPAVGICDVGWDRNTFGVFASG